MYTILAVDINSLPDDPATLKGLLADMVVSQADQQQPIAPLEQRIRLLNLIIYGLKSGKKFRTGHEQPLFLFDEAEQAVEEQRPQGFEERLLYNPLFCPMWPQNYVYRV